MRDDAYMPPVPPSWGAAVDFEPPPGPGSAELDAELDDQRAARHSPARRLTALVVVLTLLAMAVLTAGYSLFRGPPVPELTRPLPAPIPRQGAVR